MSKDSDLSGPFWNHLQDEFVEWCRETIEDLRGEMLAGGYPPFTVPLTQREKYDKLVAAQQAGDPRFYENPRAQGELQRLSQLFGPPPPIPVSPFGVV